MKFKKGDKIVRTGPTFGRIKAGETYTFERYSIYGGVRLKEFPGSVFANMNFELAKEEVGAIEEQTIMFWNLQLQFMELSLVTLLSHLQDLQTSGQYVRNRKSKKIDKFIRDLENWSIVPDQNQRECIATHLALQLSGLA